jgi:hypothetical protein
VSIGAYEIRSQITSELRATITNTVTDASPKGVGMRLAFLGKPNFCYQTFDRPWDFILKMAIGDLHRIMAWDSGAACGWQDVVDPSHRRQQGWRL